jgi:5'-nucleotidase
MSETGNIMLFDMDGSLFDYDSALIEALNKMRHPSEPEIEGNLWDLEKAPYLKARMDAVKSVPGWWKALKPIENGVKILKLAQELGFDCQILTKGPKTKSIAWMEKLECCQEHFGDCIDVHVVSDKGGFYGKVLYDDFTDYMLKWLRHRPRGLGIMPVTAQNKNFHHPQVIKWDGTNYEEVKTAMQFAFDRKPGETLRLR